MTKPTIVADITFSTASVLVGNLSRVYLSGGEAMTSSREGTHISIGGAGPSGAVAQRTIASVINGSTVDLSAPVSQAVDGKACVISTDNTAALQAAADVGGEYVDISGAGWFGSRKLNFTGTSRSRGIVGDGSPFAGPWMHPLEEGGIMLDFGGRTNVNLEGFNFGEDINGLANPNVPDCGLLLGGPSDHLYLRRICGTGHFVKAALAVRAGSGKVDGCAFWNYQNSPNAFAWGWDSDNALGLTSAANINSNVQECSPWSVIASEAHGMSGARSMLFRGARSLTWIGGTISGAVGQAGHIIIMGNSVGENGMRLCSFIGVRFESEGGNAVNIIRVESCNTWAAGLENFFGEVLPNGDKRSSNIFGCSGDIVTGTNPIAVANFRSCAVGLPRN